MKKRVLIPLVLIIVLAIAAVAQAAILVSKDPEDLAMAAGSYYYNKGNYEKAAEYFALAAALNPESKEAFHDLATSYYQLNDIKNAELNFKQSIQIDSEYAAAHYSLGLLYYHNKELDSTIENFKKAAELDSSAMHYFDLAIATVEKFRNIEKTGRISAGDLSILREGIAHYSKAVELDSDYPNAKGNLQVVKEVLNNYEGSLQR